jgi:hypothetical protein
VGCTRRESRRRPTQFLLYSYLTRDPVFELVVQHPLALPLIEYYLGNDCNLSSLTCFIKWAGGRSEGKGMGMHIDSAAANKNGEPSPSTQAPHVFNTNWILTDYTQENGCFAIIPGSHRWQRRPMVEHMEQLHAEEEMVPVEAPAGSCLIFHGNVWHGAFDKKTNGAYSTADSISQHAAIHWPVARCVPLVGTASALLLRKLRRRFA